ncbi:MAG: carbohydrate kinase family protein [Opitutales bacterium]|nr:carbohydrate kinase family protein [Opitutales bacterium]
MGRKNILIGFDGFIDTIVRAVDYYDGDNKVFIRFIDQFGKRISAAAGRSANIELDIVCKKIGGNGPILSEALRLLGATTTYIGTLGDVHENIFKTFAQKNKAISVGMPGETRAIEFDDGKILLGEMHDTAKIDADSICSACNKNMLREIVSKNELLCFVNWTMLPRMHSIFELFLTDIIDVHAAHTFFFDLADPSKRTKEDISKLINYIQRFSRIGPSILGLNLSEAQHILSVLGCQDKVIESEDSMLKCARLIRSGIGCKVVFIHANTMSVGCDDNAVFVTGYFSEHPKVSTGAGDHFNAGFLFDYLDNQNIKSALHMGSAVAKYYVEHGDSPDEMQARSIIQRAI